MSGGSERVWRGIVDDLLALADFCERTSPLDFHFIYRRVVQLREDVANTADNCGCTINESIWIKFDQAQRVITQLSPSECSSRHAMLVLPSILDQHQSLGVPAEETARSIGVSLRTVRRKLAHDGLRYVKENVLLRIGRSTL